MQEAQVAQAAAREAIEVVEIALERVRAFDAEQRGDRTFCVRRFDVFAGVAKAKLARAAERRVEHVDLFVDRAREAADFSEHRKRDQAEELPADAAFAHARQIDVTEKRLLRERRVVPREEIVAEPAAPHERVRVQIDRGMAIVKRSCL